MRPRLPEIRLFSALIFVSLTVTGCTAKTDINRFEAFAEAGVAYTDKFPVLLDQSFEVAVAADSETLKTIRSQLQNAKEKQKEKLEVALDEYNSKMKERLELHADLKRHADLLRSYFLALKSLSKLDAATGISDAAKDIAGEIGKLSPALKKKTVDGSLVEGLIAEPVKFVVASVTLEALRRELEDRGEMLERELALQEALTEAIACQIRTDQDTRLERYCSDKVIEPYMSDGELPEDWSKKLLHCLRGTIVTEAAQAAERAIRSLRLAYIAAAENRLDYSQIDDLTTAVERFVRLVSQLPTVK